jgi:hypothetical protein
MNQALVAVLREIMDRQAVSERLSNALYAQSHARPSTISADNPLVKLLSCATRGIVEEGAELDALTIQPSQPASTTTSHNSDESLGEAAKGEVSLDLIRNATRSLILKLEQQKTRIADASAGYVELMRLVYV